MSPDSIRSILKIEPRGFWKRLGSYRLLLWVGGLTLLLDQASKLWVLATIPRGAYLPPDAITVIPGFFNLIHVVNTGAAWSIFSGRSALLATVALLTLVAIFVWRRALGLPERPVQWAFGLLCGGIVGNLIDRIAYGHVVDFVDLHFGSYIYPTFNIADSGICIGVGLYLIHSFRSGSRDT